MTSMSARRSVTTLRVLGLGAALAVNPLMTRPQVASAVTKKKTTTTKSKPKPKASTVASRPNILFVLADDLGVDASPCYPTYGVVKPKMPTVEKLCQDGVVFENMTASPVCSPSRAAALTGKYAFRTNVGNVDDELSADETTIHDVVAAAPTPYANALIGKWHLGGSRPDPTQPEQLGIQYFDGFLRAQVQDYSNWPRVVQGQSANSETYTTTAFTDSAIAWTSKQTKPWFLWLAYNAAHTPFHKPPAGLASDASLSGTPEDIALNPQKYYFAALEAMDKELGRLLNTMPASVRENTVVMFMGDNGTPARVVQAPFAAATAKGTVNEGGVHVPMIVAGAGVTARGTRNSSLLNGVDVFATVATLAGAKLSGPVDSVSFAPALTTPNAKGARTFAYSELFTGTPRTGGAAGAARPTFVPDTGATSSVPRRPGARPAVGGAGAAGGAGVGVSTAAANDWAIRDERYKLVHDVVTGDEQFFDLETDPSESVPLDLSGPLAPVAARLRGIASSLRGS